MLVLAVADKALDIIGLCTVIYWTFKGAWWLAHRKQKSKTQPKPRAFRLND